ncbi:MAG: hypothetical protein IPJ20_24360 [Flammeovirgaceae bacterium]|nr:hypothetical protein [Flammeovirgaceae bacterium]
MVATGNNQLISKSTKVRNPSTQSLSIGAEWDWKIYDRVGVNSISQRLSASLDGIYIPNVNVKAVSNDPFIPNEKYYNLSAQLSLFFNPF